MRIEDLVLHKEQGGCTAVNRSAPVETGKALRGGSPRREGSSNPRVVAGGLARYTSSGHQRGGLL